MQRQPLGGQWAVREAGTADWRPASVPGGVHTDLLAAGQIPDPFVGDNERRVQWVAERDWEYRRSFVPAPEVLAEAQVELVADGLGTLAEVWLNGEVLGQTANEFCAQRWDVRRLLRPGDNELLIRFRSPVGYITARQRERPLPSVEDMVIPGGQYLRTAPYHFGWDWGPKLPTIGIWQDIGLAGWSTARLDDVHLRQQHVGGAVTLTADVMTTADVPDGLVAEITVTTPDGETLQATTDLAGGAGSLALPIPEPQLWWPNGHGDQPLYRVVVRLRAGEEVLDERAYQVGLRTLELRQQDDEWGRSFTFVVNGRPIFCKGANWIPADSFATRVTPARLEQLIAAAAATHQNMLRVWGGGYYEQEAFYDLCDRYGLLVWQDFMFACAAYPLDEPDFVASIEPEVVGQVRRLRHRACLALWCGNNEIEVAWASWGWARPELAGVQAADERFFYHTLAGWVAAADPDRAYWPSSPSSGQPYVDPNGDAAGDTHQWEVWHALKPFAGYREKQSRFVSEFGFQALPALATIASFADPADWNMTSYVMEQHQRNVGGNGRIVTYLTSQFRLPKDFPSLVYVSQLLEAEALRVGVEHWRGLWPRTAGTLYWQLDDCWPVASWASIDYFGRWKAAHYAARRFYAPLLLAAHPEGTTVSLAVHNDRAEPFAGQVRWSLETLDGQALATGEAPVTAEPFAVSQPAALDFADRVDEENRRRVVLVCELWQGDEPVGRRVVPFAPDKHLSLADPGLATSLYAAKGQLVVEVRARVLARFVELALEGTGAVFSDNDFDLPARRAVTVTCPLPPGWTVDQARAALHVRSLFDSYTEAPRPPKDAAPVSPAAGRGPAAAGAPAIARKESSRRRRKPRPGR